MSEIIQGFNLDEKTRKLIYEELPRIFQQHPLLKYVVWDICANKFADKNRTEDRFELLLDELRKERERSDRRFEKFEQRMEKFDQRLDKLQEELRKDRELNEKRFEKMQKQWNERLKKMEERTDKKFEKLIEKIGAADKRIKRTIGALGARWGLSS